MGGFKDIEFEYLRSKIGVTREKFEITSRLLP
jgi:hypothetical protein